MYYIFVYLKDDKFYPSSFSEMSGMSRNKTKKMAKLIKNSLINIKLIKHDICKMINQRNSEANCPETVMHWSSGFSDYYNIVIIHCNVT